MDDSGYIEYTQQPSSSKKLDLRCNHTTEKMNFQCSESPKPVPTQTYEIERNTIIILK